MIESIEGDHGRLSLVAADNCVGIAVIETMKLLGQASCGVSLKLNKVEGASHFSAESAGQPIAQCYANGELKCYVPRAVSYVLCLQGLPLGSGMGSSAASAAAGAWAVNALFGEPLSKEQLVIPGLTSEATVSGYHADNIAPALLGGFILIRYVSGSLCLLSSLELVSGEPDNLARRSCEPLDIQQLLFPGELHFVLVNPTFEAPTKKMRAALPKLVPMSATVTNCSQGASLVREGPAGWVSVV